MAIKTHPAPLLVAAALALYVARPAAAEDLTYDGATTIGSKIMKEAAPAFEKKTGNKFASIGTAGTGKGLKAALAGEVSVAGVSRSLTPEELSKKPAFLIIGFDALGVFVSEKNPVKALSKAQLKAIYTGKVKNWKDVGGANLPIVACSEGLKSGRATVESFKTMVLDGETYGPVTEKDDASDCVKLAAQDAGVVGPASMAYAQPGARALPVDGVKPSADEVRAGNYLLARPLLLVAKTKPAGALKSFFDFMLSTEGQAIVGKSFVPAR
jgi:phosphate transport system substrate-binding protein